MVLMLGTKDNSCQWVPEHVNYFTEQGLRRLFQRHGLTVMRRDYVTRVRPDALSARIAVPGASRVLEALVRYGQQPVAWLANVIGRGTYIICMPGGHSRSQAAKGAENQRVDRCRIGG
jgi:hypothetical protein